jgi:hypothetical protein
MLDVVLVTSAPIHVYAKDIAGVLSMVETHLDPGDYIVSSEGMFAVVAAGRAPYLIR